MLDSIKNDTTFVPMKFPDAELSKEYITIIKKYWTLPTVIVPIKYAEVKQHVQLGNSFLTLEGHGYHGQFESEKPFVQEIDYLDQSTRITLKFWTISDKLLKKYKKDAKKKPDYWTWCRREIAMVEFAAGITTIRDLNHIYQSDYDCGGYIYGWGKGYIKNVIQLICHYLNNPNEPKEIPVFHKKSMDAYYVNEKEIGQVKYVTLYVPDYIMIRVRANLKGIYDDGTHEVNELLKAYKLKYVVLTEKEMNEKLLNDEGFYYVKVSRSAVNRVVSVIDSRTGKIIYSWYYGGSGGTIGGNSKPDDFKDLYKAITGQ